MDGLEGVARDAMGFQIHEIEGCDFASYSKAHSEAQEERTDQWLELREIIASSTPEENGKWQQLLRQGVPLGQRHWVWAHLCGAVAQRKANPTLYSELVTRSQTELANDPIAYYIDVDLPRTFSGDDVSPPPGDPVTALLSVGRSSVNRERGGPGFTQTAPLRLLPP